MDSTKVFIDSIYAVVNLSSAVPAPKQECWTNWDKVAIVAIIAVASLVAVSIITKFISRIVWLKKHEGIKNIVEKIIAEKDVKRDEIKPIVEEILKEKNVNNDGIKAIVEEILEDKDKDKDKEKNGK